MCPGFPLWCSKWRAARRVGEPARWRVGRWPWLGLGWPESTAASSAAAAGVRSCTETRLELEDERSKALGMLYGALRACWTRRGDQMVTGAASTASSAAAEVQPWWRKGYDVRVTKRRGGNGGGAHRGCSGRRSGLGDALETAGRRWGSTAAGDEEGDGVGDGARPLSLGSSRTMRMTRRSF